MEPAATLRGFAYKGFPAFACGLFKASRFFVDIQTSPSTIISIGRSRERGTLSIVRMLWVTSSPTRPFPRVAAVLRRPFSYSSTIFSPSILSSHTYDGIFPFSKRLMRASHSYISSGVKASLNDHCAILCLTFLNAGRGAPATRCVGESGDERLGY